MAGEVTGLTENDCGEPLAALSSAVAATEATSVQIPELASFTVCPSPPTVQTPVVSEATEVVPLELVLTWATKLPPTDAELGMSVMCGAVGVALATVKDCALPVAEEDSTPAATWAVSVQVPVPTKETARPFAPTVQTAVVLELTDFVPSPVVPTAAVKEPPMSAPLGMLVTAGELGVPGSTGTPWGCPSAAPKVLPALT